jgi:maltooligosyltrehalose trehalohydrolase
VLLSPFTPLLFMGEEYGEQAPFQYFVSHGQCELIEAVRKGRRAEFAAFGWDAEMPDPCSEATFERCLLTRELHETKKPHFLLHSFYREALRLRKQLPGINQAQGSKVVAKAYDDQKCLAVRYQTQTEETCLVMNFSDASQTVAVGCRPGTYELLLDSSDPLWGGPDGSLPDRLTSIGKMLIEMPPSSVVLLTNKD